MHIHFTRQNAASQGCLGHRDDLHAASSQPPCILAARQRRGIHQARKEESERVVTTNGDSFDMLRIGAGRPTTVQTVARRICVRSHKGRPRRLRLIPGLISSQMQQFSRLSPVVLLGAVLLHFSGARAAEGTSAPEVVNFQSQGLELAGELFKPKGEGPFPAILYNHGSAPGMLNSQASANIGPLFAAKGWVFFMPYRRGQGLSAKAGAYIGDEIARARARGGRQEATETLVRLMETDHLQDQLAALRWLRSQKFIQENRVAVAGNSFGGVQTVLGASRALYCAAVDAAGGAESWNDAPELQTLMKAAVRTSRAPILFFQAENDYNVAPSETLFAAMKAAGKDAELKIYPPYGLSDREGHSFAYRGSAVWFTDVLAFVRRHCS